MRVRVDFDIQSENFEQLRNDVDSIFFKASVPVANWVIQAPLCQEDFEDRQKNPLNETKAA